MARRSLPITYGQKPRRKMGQALFGVGNRSYLPRVWQSPVPRRSTLTERGHVHHPEISREAATKSMPGIVQGRKASDLEMRVYRTLLRLGWSDASIAFQVDILGGRQPGGQVLDFVVENFGMVTVIFVNGNYWHKYGGDFQKNAEAEAAVLAAFPGVRVFSLWTGDLMDDAQADRVLLRIVGRGGGY